MDPVVLSRWPSATFVHSKIKLLAEEFSRIGRVETRLSSQATTTAHDSIIVVRVRLAGRKSMFHPRLANRGTPTSKKCFEMAGILFYQLPWLSKLQRRRLKAPKRKPNEGSASILARQLSDILLHCLRSCTSKFIGERPHFAYALPRRGPGGMMDSGSAFR